MMKKLNINLSENSYPILIGNGLFSKLFDEIYKRRNYDKILILVDGNVNRIYRKQIIELIDDFFTNKGTDASSIVKLLSIKPGETSKSIETLSRVYSFMIDNNFGRDSLVIALGGGVVGDLAGFAASTFMRGVDYIQVPTTLLSVVDSSVGGKTGINFLHTKNIVGSFYQPKFVLIDLDFLKSLNKTEVLCGSGEILKYAFMTGRNFYSYIKNNINKLLNLDNEVLIKIVTECLKIKGSVVESDEKESGLRKILNLGHTFAHAYESVLEYKVKHGEAVAAGLVCAVILSKRLNLLDEALYLDFTNFLNQFAIRKLFNNLDKQKLYSAMLKDKKNRAGKIKFVLPHNIGELLVDVEADKDDVIYTLNEFENIVFKNNK
jgi:3-dehydroquinate synthase